MRPLRWVLTAGLIFGVYRETGPFTAIAIALIGVTLELLPVMVEREVYRTLIDVIRAGKESPK